MKKKFNIFLAVVCAMTMLFGSTLCFAAENVPSVESSENGRAARSMSGSEQKTISVGNTGVVAIVRLSFAYDSGYTGWFTGADRVSEIVPGNLRVQYISTSTSPVGNNSYITVTVTYVINDIWYDASATFYVDEWGTVS